MVHFLTFPILHPYFPMASQASLENLTGLLLYFQAVRM